MHPTRKELIVALRGSSELSFTELLSAAAETSDNLTYHLKKLQQEELIKKNKSGTYSLAPDGLLYITTNQEKYDGIYPTVSCLLRLETQDGKYLLMVKKKQPNIGSVHDSTFALYSGMSTEYQIAKFCEKYHITLDSDAAYCGTYRLQKTNANETVFDKVFLVYTGVVLSHTQKIEDREFLSIGRENFGSYQLAQEFFDIDRLIKSEAHFIETTTENKV
jgi:DNA-binding transcriptional ArsR family regulator